MKSNVRAITFVESEISADIRKYLDEVKKEYATETIQPGEFTMAMFHEQTKLKDSAARAVLSKEIELGKITVRKGRNTNNIPCFLYKVVK